jgi:hypothetical protein
MSYEIPEVHIPREYAFADAARIIINDDFLDILVTDYTEDHAENVQVSNMLSDSVSLYTYGALPIQITMNGIVKESQEANHLFSVMKKYKNEWRQRLTTDFHKNTHLVMMDLTMDIAITGITITKEVDLVGYDAIILTCVGWNYTFPKSKLERLFDRVIESKVEELKLTTPSNVDVLTTTLDDIQYQDTDAVRAGLKSTSGTISYMDLATSGETPSGTLYYANGNNSQMYANTGNTNTINLNDGTFHLTPKEGEVVVVEQTKTSKTSDGKTVTVIEQTQVKDNKKIKAKKTVVSDAPEVEEKVAENEYSSKEKAQIEKKLQEAREATAARETQNKAKEAAANYSTQGASTNKSESPNTLAPLQTGTIQLSPTNYTYSGGGSYSGGGTIY